MKNIVLVGFMGTGKSSIGQALAEALNRPLIDTDDVIEADNRVKIGEIFAQYGEAHFRDLETAAVRKVAALKNHVIATGGGAVLRKENMKMLRQSGIVFCLTATPEEIWRRVKAETYRPLLQTPDPLGKIQEMLRIRAPFYAEADYQISTTGRTIHEVAQAIQKVMLEKADHSC